MKWAVIFSVSKNEARYSKLIRFSIWSSVHVNTDQWPFPSQANTAKSAAETARDEAQAAAAAAKAAEDAKAVADAAAADAAKAAEDAAKPKP